MNADEIVGTIRGNRLAAKVTFKLRRMLSSSVSLMPPDVLRDMREKEPELFRPELPDDEGCIRYPWHEEYNRLYETFDLLVHVPAIDKRPLPNPLCVCRHGS